MKLTTGLLCAAALLFSTASLADTGKSTAVPLASVDFERFAGTWYEIASKPSFGQRSCVATESIYTPREDGKLNIENRCRKKTFDGDWRNLEGKIWNAPDSVAQGELTLQVFWPFTSKLWILDISADYQTAILGTPELSTVWLLSKSRSISDAQYASAMAQITEMGFDTSVLRKTPQPGS